MASESEQTAEAAGRVQDGQRLVWVVMGVLGAVLALGAIVLGSKPVKGDAGGRVGVRAVLIPTDDRARTLVIPPCNTPPEAARDAAAVRSIVGAATIVLPQGGGVRTIQVPRCLTPSGAAAPTEGANLPSAAFISTLPPGEGRARENDAAAQAQSRLIVPNGSEATTVVVPPCAADGTEIPADATKTEKGQQLVLNPREAGSDTAVAPSC